MLGIHRSIVNRQSSIVNRQSSIKVILFYLKEYKG